MNSRYYKPSIAVILFLFMLIAVCGKVKTAEASSRRVIASGNCGKVLYDDYGGIKRKGNVRYKLYKNGTMVISGNGEMGNFGTFTDCGTKYKMEKLMPWYKYRANIKKLVLKKGVKTIGKNAFQGCTNLKTITWAASIKTVNDYAFCKCDGLEKIKLPSSVKHWENSVFAQCRCLKKVTMDEDFQFYYSVKYHDEDDIIYESNVIGEINVDGWYMFNGCTRLKTVILSEQLKAIPPYFVKGCKNIKKFTVPSGVEYWGSFPNSLCTGKYVLPASVKILGIGGFAGCTNLKGIVLPEGLETIQHPFEGCSSLREAELPGSVKRLDSAFYQCTELESITIPETVIGFGTRLFEGCTNLKSVNLPGNMPYIPSYCFKECVNLEKIKLPLGIGYIGDYAFEGCQKLKEIALPDSVDEFGEYMFKDCISLEEVEWNLKKEYYIEKGAFQNCQKLKEIILSENAYGIGGEAFSDCESLKELVIPQNVRILHYNLFSNCKNLKSITVLSDNITFLDNRVFDGIPKNIIIYVPKGRFCEYKETFRQAGIKVDKQNIQELS